MNVIFLDIDGVLNSSRSTVAFQHRERILRDSDSTLAYYYKHTMKTIDPVAIGLINRIIKETKAKIVLSSTHRKHFIDRSEGEPKFNLSDIGIYLTALGIKGQLIGAIPTLGGHRGTEIKAWMDAHPRPTIKKYLIIDDDSDMLDEQIPFFVKTTSNDGISFKNYLEAIKILNGTAEDNL